MKVQTMVTIDEELKRIAKRHQICISTALNEYLQVLVDRQEQDVDGINIELERNKLSKLQKKASSVQIEINTCQKNILNWENKQQKKEEERLKKEKDLIESQSKCMNCGNPIQHKSHKFKVGNVCNACYMTSTSEDIEKWNKK